MNPVIFNIDREAANYMIETSKDRKPFFRKCSIGDNHVALTFWSYKRNCAKHMAFVLHEEGSVIVSGTDNIYLMNYLLELVEKNNVVQ